MNWLYLQAILQIAYKHLAVVNVLHDLHTGDNVKLLRTALAEFFNQNIFKLQVTPHSQFRVVLLEILSIADTRRTLVNPNHVSFQSSQTLFNQWIPTIKFHLRILHPEYSDFQLTSF